MLVNQTVASTVGWISSQRSSDREERDASVREQLKDTQTKLLNITSPIELKLEDNKTLKLHLLWD